MKALTSRTEFIILIAFMISLVAMATDLMLPGLGMIASDLGQSDPNAGHLVISVLFAGFALGQLIVGPLSDCYGRRAVIHGSYTMFCAGAALSLFAASFEMLLLGRVLQGLGMAGPRIVSVAIVRDGYEGRAMAKIMSFVMAVFIIVPAIAPAVGQVIIALSGWRATFSFLLVMAALSWIWFSLRQPETLSLADRRVFTFKGVWQGIKMICQNRAALGYTICAGLIFGPFLAYLSLAQQIFQLSYDKGDAFAIWFGVAALSIGAASILNSALVERWGMKFLSNLALMWVILVAAIFMVVVLMSDGLPPFGFFMIWVIATFFAMGLLFGNLNALAMEPLGKMAGLGAAVVGSLATFISIPIGFAISENFNGGVGALVAGFGIVALAALLIGKWASSASGQPAVG
ncbi:MAG: multidrug effflux MFS transporter [Sulfitobacter sp.]